MPSLIRGRPRRGAVQLRARVTHTLVGALAGVVWLLLPGMVVPDTASVRDETSTADLVLPLVAVVAVLLLSGYGYARRSRRARTPTTPASTAVPAPVPASPLAVLDERARALLIEADDRVRARREELGFTREASHARSLEEAEAELAAAFRIRQQYEDGIPEDEPSRRHALAGIVGRCEEAKRRLEGFGAGAGREALEAAEHRFRELAARAGGAEATVAELGERYGPTATGSVAGYVEQAKDQLVLATGDLNQARQSTDLAEEESAVRHLRAAETSIARATALLGAVDRLAADLASAESLLPAALTGAEAELSGVTGRADADRVLAAVRQELTAGPYDPLDALRRVVGATARVGVGRQGVLSAAARLVADSTVSGADTFVTTHRETVGSAARIRLAEARRLLLTEPWTAGPLAHEAWELAGRDVHGDGS
ncbi:hypothetical protein ACIRVK_00760 [Streptomyces sp. NPDC101152]|uniref:hypothetical protein n=1 Tax=Streptomyces sp. NPDC101152 TaxID=3366116 RepID=UPI0037FAC6AA